MDTLAIVLDGPERLSLSRLALTPPGSDDLVVEIDETAVSAGTERLLFTGAMPDFPGMGYPLVPGYEAIGRVVEVGSAVDGFSPGDRVFVPGARCFGPVRGLFGGAARHLVTPASRVARLDGFPEEEGLLLALAATAYHALSGPLASLPDLVIGHGVLGRLVARIAVALGGEAPVVHETSPQRRGDGVGPVLDPATDDRRDYAAIYECSGDAAGLDRWIGRLRRGGEIALAGFYHAPLSFAFPPAFMREARLRVAAEWLPEDLAAVRRLVVSGALRLDGLITHRAPATDAARAYRTAFGDPACLKMALDWRTLQ
jgi:3-hydroxyethyl bacteriochlorophyllide a dehydrogenase